MNPNHEIGCCGITRRGFLLGTGAGLAVGTPLAWMGLQGFRKGNDPHLTIPSFTGRSQEIKKPVNAMPGPYPGRVVEVHDPASVSDANEIQGESVRKMMARGMCEMTGADHPVEAWRRFFEPDDVVGIKVNPVGRKRPDNPRAVESISSPEVLLEIVAGLKSAGVKPRNMIVFERYANEFRDTGYETVMRERAMQDIRWYASASGYDNSQLSIDGHDGRSRKDRDVHVVGYDPDVFVHMGFSTDEADPKDDRRFRSHLSLIVTKMVNKIVTIPVLKDHRSAGVTLALKNLSHGMNNNVARSHLGNRKRQSGLTSGPNQCDTFIPTAAGQPLIREKATLHIMDGLIGVYEGGPGCWNRTWATWRYKSLFFATDPVAMDHVGWDIIDAKRVEEGWPPVARMGQLYQTPAAMLSPRLAALAAQSTSEATALAPVGPFFPGHETEQFDRRQPEHIILAGTIGMGVFDARNIDHRRIVVRS